MESEFGAMTDRHKVRGFLLRIPSELRREVERLAKDHGQSINQEIIHALRQYIEREAK